MAFAFLYVGFQGLCLSLVWSKNPVSKSLGTLGHFIRCVTVIIFVYETNDRLYLSSI